MATTVNNISNVEQAVGGLAAGVAALEAGGASASSVAGSARSWNVLGHSDGSTATGSLGSHGPGSSDDSRNTRRGPDTFSSPEDEQSRSAVLLRFFCEQYHTGITNWLILFRKGQTFQPTINLSHFIARQVPCRQARIRNKSQMSGLRCPKKDDGKLKVHFAAPKRLSRCANPNHSKSQHQGSNKWRWKPVFKLVPFGSGQLFALVAPDLCVPGLRNEVLQRGSSLKPAQPMCDGRPFASQLVRRLSGRGALFRGFPCRWVLHFVISLTRSVIVHDAASCSREDSLYECGRPRDTMSCLFFTSLWLQRCQSILVQDIQPANFFYDLLQDVLDQGHHILTGGTLVPGLAAGSDCKIRSIQTFLA